MLSATLMPFRAEYLSDPRREDSVCYEVVFPRDHLPEVVRCARLGAEEIGKHTGALGFQVRDLSDAGRIVHSEAFNA